MSRSFGTASNILQTIGIAGQIVSGCLDGFSAWQTASNLGRDAIELQIRLEWTRGRLEMWGRDWGLEQGDHLKDPRFRHSGMMALNHLVYINFCLEDFESMDDIFPTLSEAGLYATTPAVSLARLSKSAGVTADEMEALRLKLSKLQTDAGKKERIRWALQEGRALKVAETVKAMVEDLYTHFPPPVAAEVTPIISNKYLISDSLESLDAVSDSSTADPTLAALCAIKAEKIRTELKERTQKLRTEDPFLKANRLDATDRQIVVNGKWVGGLREDGVRYAIPVLVEEKQIPQLVLADSSSDVRIQNVARLLSMKDKPTELRTLDCVGVTISRDQETMYRFVHELKAKHAFTLTHLLRTPTRENILGCHRDKWALEKKFALARQLARAVLYLHLAGWLHKGIRSNNVVFCADREDAVDLSEPFLVGFEYSRAEAARFETETVVVADDADNAFRHPDTQGVPTERGQYQRAFDVYSLGMVLLDIGSKRSVGNLRTKFVATTNTPSAPGFRDWLLREAIDSDVTGLAARVGSVYTEVVKTCLKGTPVTSKAEFSTAFYVSILRPLQLCKV